MIKKNKNNTRLREAAKKKRKSDLCGEFIVYNYTYFPENVIFVDNDTSYIRCKCKYKNTYIQIIIQIFFHVK